MRIGVVINRRASGNAGAGARSGALAEIVGGDGWVHAPESFEALSDAMKDFVERGIDVLAACGGDGTFFRTLTAMVRAYGNSRYPLFLPLRAGAMNTIARGLGCPRWSPERMLSAVVAKGAEGALETMRRPLLEVNGENFGFMAGAGTIVSFLRAYYEGPRQGPWGAFLLLSRLALSAAVGGPRAREVLRRPEASMTCDGTPVPFGSFSVIYASTIADIGLGFRPTYRALETRDRFHCLAGPLEAREIVRRLARIRRGLPMCSAQLHDALARRVEVEFRRPEPYMIDGDVLEPVERLSIGVGPELRVIRRVREE